MIGNTISTVLYLYYYPLLLIFVIIIVFQNVGTDKKS